MNVNTEMYLKMKTTVNINNRKDRLDFDRKHFKKPSFVLKLDILHSGYQD